MPTRKQRRRREKTFRHEYETVMLDAEGNEIPLDPDEQKAEREERERGRERSRPAGRGGTKQQQQQKKKRARPLREVQPPTWRRALRRGGIMGGLMFVLFVFVLKSGSTTARALTASVYAVMFIPLTYWADRLAYRTYIRRLDASGKQPAAKPRR